MIKQPIFAVISLVLLIAVIGFGVSRSRFIARAERAEGIVSSVSSYSTTCGGGKRRRRYSCTKFNATVQYRDRSGREYQTSLSAGSSSGSSVSVRYASLQQGAQVALLYDPENPSTVFKDGFFDLWGLPLILAVFQVATMFASFSEFSRRTRF